MSGFNTEVNVAKAEVVPAADGSAFQVVLHLGLVVPMMTPDGGVTGAMTELGIVRYNVNDRAEAEEFALAYTEAVETLPKPSNLGDFQIASSLRDVERTAQALRVA